MMRSERWRQVLGCFLVCLGCAASGLSGQEPRWRLSASGNQAWFSGGVTDTTDATTDYTLTPTVVWTLAADHSLGDIRVGVGLSYFSARLGVTGDIISIVDETVHFGYWEVSAVVVVPLVRVGKGGAGLSLSAGPTLGIWSITSVDPRTRVGGTATLQFAAPITPAWRLLASAGGAVSGSPFTEDETPVEFEIATLWRGQVGLGVQFGF